MVSPAQAKALAMIVARGKVEKGEGVSLPAARGLAARGLVTVTEWCGRYGDAKQVTHWTATITAAGKASAR